MTRIITDNIFSTECSTAEANVIKIATAPRCTDMRPNSKRGIQAFDYGQMFCNATGIFYYGCNDTVCGDCDTTAIFYQGASKSFARLVR
jgi:hypothetical protein